MTAYFPGKTAKQICDKKREAPYKRLLQTLMEAKDETISPQPDTQAAREDMELTPTEDTEASIDTLDTTEQGAVSIQPSPQTTITEEQDPEILPNRIPDWEVHNIGQVLANRPAEDILTDSFQVLQDHLSAILQEAQENREFLQQETVDRVNKMLVDETLRNCKNSKRPNKRGGSSNQKVKQKKKCYLYPRTQEYYEKYPGALASYIRQGIPWPDREAIFPPEIIKQLYTDLWRKRQRWPSPLIEQPPVPTKRRNKLFYALSRPKT